MPGWARKEEEERQEMIREQKIVGSAKKKEKRKNCVRSKFGLKALRRFTDYMLSSLLSVEWADFITKGKNRHSECVGAVHSM